MDASSPIDRSSGVEEIPTQEYAFETVIVDAHGEIRERQTHTARRFTEHLAGSIPLEMTLIPGGLFLMGSRAGEGFDDERPQHNVKISPFLMSRYTITQEQWAAVMPWAPPYRCKGNRRPADRVSRQDATAFCKKLSELTGRAYRLPSEAEWEYACRARTTTPFYFGETITTGLANYVGEHLFRSEPKGVYRHETTEVGAFPPNPFGFNDMHGNVWEWCADSWHENYLGAPFDGSVWLDGAGPKGVLRGGCWHDPPNLCRCAARLAFLPREGEDFFGFRVVLASLDRNSSASTRRILGHPRAWFGLDS